MIEFTSPTLCDYEKFAPFFFDEGELSCEMNFISIYVWQRIYENKFYLDDKTLIFKSIADEGGGYVFSLPYGDLDYGMSLIFEYCRHHGITPNFWTSEGKRLTHFKKKYQNFELIPQRDNFDYIYSREDLATLSGKKYHSKRNHISSFTKKYNWTYEELTPHNKEDFLAFSDKWYSDRGIESDEGLKAEKKALGEILDSSVKIPYKGALIRVDGRVVAITLGSPINEYTFDIHYEKADIDYPTAYAVINREFAKNSLSEYKYINREDDLGLEGLRKAKLSYKPQIILPKYSLIYHSAEKLIADTKRLYKEAFPLDGEYADIFTDRFFDDCRYIIKDGKIVSMLYLLKAKLHTQADVCDAFYLYAAATLIEYRGQGLMSELIEKVKKETACPIITKPAEPSLFTFYQSLGFESTVFELETSVIQDCSSEQLLTTDEYKNARESLLADIPHIELCNIDFALEELNLYKTKEGILALDGNCVKEFIPLSPKLSAVPFGMAYQTNDNIYLGIALD